MKNLIRSLFAFFVLSAMAFVSCQHEENQISESAQTLSKTSDLTSLLKRVTTPEFDDNTIDSASCFKIKLPVMLSVNGQELYVENVEGYQQAANILNESYSDTNYIDYQFPITVIYNDGTQVSVPDRTELSRLQVECPLPQQNESPIGCISLQFPITILGYDIENQLQSTQTVNYLSDMLGFLLGLDETTFYSLSYPISITNSSGITVVINSNSELTAAIQTAADDCNCNNPRIVTDNLIVYIPFANEIKDLTGFSTPTISGDYHFVTDRNGNPNGAISFDSGNVNIQNSIAIPDSDANDLMQNQNFSVSLWFKRQDNSGNNPVEQLFSNDAFTLYFGNSLATGMIGPFVIVRPNDQQMYDSSWLQQDLGNDIANWHHIVIVYESAATAMWLYRDGNRTPFLVNALPDEARRMIFGNNYKGYMDDIRVYKKALNEYEINLLYHLDGDVNTCLFRR